MEQEYEYAEQSDEQDVPLDEPSLEEDISLGDDLQEEPEQDNDDEEEESAQRKKRGSRPSAHHRIQEIQREKYQALDELRRAREEIDSLRKVSSELNHRAEGYGNAALIHYDNSANLRLEQAKSKAIKASEDGDIQAMIDANVEIASIAAERQRINEYKEDMESNSNKNYSQSQDAVSNVQQQNQYTVQPDPNVANEWLSNNSWFSAQSEDYNPDLVEAINEYSEKLENICYRQNRPDLIMSREYFQEIDNYKNSLTVNSRRQLDMKPARSGVSPVRNGASQSSSQKKQVQLSTAEKELARRSGVSDSVFLQYKIADIKKQKEKMRQNGMYR